MSEAAQNLVVVTDPSDWLNCVECAGEWKLGNPMGRGESAPMHATRADGVKGVAKPAIRADGTPRAAHEKIAGDLAKHIGFSVPPTVLWTDTDTNQLYSISSWACKQPEIWELQNNSLSDTFKRNCAQAMADISVFHTWIADTDRHAGNTLIDLESTENNPVLFFIDHAFCFTFNPAFCSLTLSKVVHGYYPQEHITNNMLANGVNLIEKFGEDKIREIVSRIPLPFLPADKSDTIIRELLRRRSLLRSVFNV